MTNLDPHVRVQTEPFVEGDELAAVRAGNPAVGAVACFVGLVRDVNEGDQVADMTLEHYPGMTEKALRDIAVEAAGRFDLIDVRIVHRVGLLRPTEPIVLVAVASAHRAAAFEGCWYVMDFLKTRAPFWKRESRPGAPDRWVDARDSDASATQRWAEDPS